MTISAAVAELLDKAKHALARAESAPEVMVLISHGAWTRVYGIEPSDSGETVELVLDEDGKSTALVITSALIGIRQISARAATIGFH